MPARITDSQPGTRGMEDLSFYLGRAYHHYCLVLEDSLRANGVDGCIRPGMGPVMFVLFESSHLTLRELGEAADLSPSTVTEVVQKLEKAGVLARKPCERDGRASRISLTAKGRGLRRRMEAVSRDVNGLLEGGLSQGGTARLRDHLATMIEAMRSRRSQAKADGTKPRKPGKRSRPPAG